MFLDLHNLPTCSANPALGNAWRQTDNDEKNDKDESHENQVPDGLDKNKVKTEEEEIDCNRADEDGRGNGGDETNPKPNDVEDGGGGGAGDGGGDEGYKNR